MMMMTTTTMTMMIPPVHMLGRAAVFLSDITLACATHAHSIWFRQSACCGHTLEAVCWTWMCVKRHLCYAELHSFVWESTDDVVQCVYIKDACFLVWGCTQQMPVVCLHRLQMERGIPHTQDF